jgi:hypothetical protein
MIPRHQKYLFGILLVASLVMGVVLWELREHAHQRLIAGQDSAHTSAPIIAPAEEATLMVANDYDGSLRTQVYSLPLPADSSARARAVLSRLLEIYAAPNAAHAVPGGGGSVSQVFLMPAGQIGATGAQQQSGPQLAVVNLVGSFAAGHPSGIETEMLTVLSISGTLHANLPRVTEVRFLVDGRERATLAGHADLTRTYLTGDAAPIAGAH